MSGERERGRERAHASLVIGPVFIRPVMVLRALMAKQPKFRPTPQELDSPERQSSPSKRTRDFPSEPVFEHKRLTGSSPSKVLRGNARSSPSSSSTDDFQIQCAMRFWAAPVPRVDCPAIDADTAARFIPLERQTDIDLQAALELRQRTPGWHARRFRRITGSKHAKALGFFGREQRLQCWYDTYVQPSAIPLKYRSQEDEISKERMSWGTVHEDDGVATLLAHLGAAFDLEIRECVLQPVRLSAEHRALIRDLVVTEFKREWTPAEAQIWDDFLMTSPDGVVYLRRLQLLLAVELKCKYGNRTPHVYDSPPDIYYGQQQAHIATDAALQGCLFASWAPDFTGLWWTAPNPSYWRLALPWLVRFHDAGLRGIPPEDIPDSVVDELREVCQTPSIPLGLVRSFSAPKEKREKD